MNALDDAIAKLSAAPQQVEDAIRGLTEEQLSWKPTEFFSIRENVLHLRDIDVLGYEKRLRLILTEDFPVLPDIDGGKLAIEREYNRLPVRPALDDLKRSRAISMQRLRGCSLHDLDRRAEMQGSGPVDVRKLVELWVEHDRGHIADLLELRRSIENGSGPSLAQHKVA
jgi:DinB family protein